jgi:hypothetical protein
MQVVRYSTCDLSSQPRLEGCGNCQKIPSRKRPRTDGLGCNFAALPQIELSDGCNLATPADYRTSIPTKFWFPS